MIRIFKALFLLVVLLFAFSYLQNIIRPLPVIAQEPIPDGGWPEPPPPPQEGEKPPNPAPGCVGTFQTCEAEGKGTYEGNPIQTCTYTPTPYTEQRCRSETYDCNCAEQCNENESQCTTVCETCTRTNCFQQNVSRECKWCDAFLENGDCGQGFITAGNDCKVRDGSIPLYWYDLMSLPPGVPSCYNSRNQQWCCGPPVTPQITCNITTTGLTSKGTTIINGRQTINRYEATKGTAYPSAFRLDGTVSNGGGNVAVEIWRSKITPECWYGYGANCSSEPSFSTRSSVTNTLTSNFDTASVEPGSYYLMCDAYQQYFGSQFKCSGSPFYTSYPKDGWTFCGENSRIQVDVVDSSTAPTGICLNSQYNGAVPETPVTWTWSGATGLQVWDANGIWYYNSSATSPKTINGIPPGRAVYARTTNNFTTFSNITTLSACPLPAAYPDITVSGSLQQNSGGACYIASGSNTFNNPSIAASSNPSQGVTSICTVSPSASTATGFSCAVTIDNQGEVQAGRPEPWPSTTLTLNASVGGVNGVWASSPSGGSGGTCNLSGTTLPVTTSGTPYSKDIAFDYTGNKWYKIKNSSFNGTSTTNITVPDFVTSYDADDDGLKYFASGASGSVLNTGVQPGTAYSNPNNWYSNPYSRTALFNPSAFSDYVRSRKSYTAISTLADITGDGIYLINGSLSINNTKMGYFVNKKIVIVVAGDVSFDLDITNNIFNPVNASIAFITTGKVDFANLKEASGIFVANTIETGTTENQGLKIKGNLIGLSSSSGERTWSDTSRPGLFVVFDPKQYLDLLPYLSIAKYEQTIR